MMTVWEQANIVANSGEELTPENFAAQMAGTEDNHIYGSVPFGCADARRPTPPSATPRSPCCSGTARPWSNVVPVYSGIDLIAGTELKPGP